MKKKLALTICSSVLSIGMLTACGAGAGNNNELIEPENVRYNNNNMYDNVRYNNDQNGLFDDNQYDNNLRNNRNGMFNNNNGNGVIDNPFQMDENEPDFDEEPSEEIRDNRNNNGLNLDTQR